MGNGGVYLEDQEDQLSLHHDQEELTYNQVSHQGRAMEKWSFLDSPTWQQKCENCFQTSFYEKNLSLWGIFSQWW